MAANRPTTRRRSAKQAFEDDDAPAPKRPRAEVNGTGKRATGATKKAPKAAYDEDDDGFQFSRRTSKRTTKAQPAPEPIPEPAREEPLPVKSTARWKKALVPALDPESAGTQKHRRSTRLSGDKEQLEARPQATEPSATQRTKKSAPVAEKRKQITPAPEAQPEQKTVSIGVKTPTQNELTVTKARDRTVQKITLPFADTPVITRNKEMRKGSKDSHRRSSTGLRGRRASSLIDGGMSNGESIQPTVHDLCTVSQGVLRDPMLTCRSVTALRSRGARLLQVHRTEPTRTAANETTPHVVRLSSAAR
jgi:kinetochore protein Mis13/DSN1